MKRTTALGVLLGAALLAYIAYALGRVFGFEQGYEYGRRNPGALIHHGGIFTHEWR